MHERVLAETMEPYSFITCKVLYHRIIFLKVQTVPHLRCEAFDHRLGLQHDATDAVDLTRNTVSY